MTNYRCYRLKGGGCFFTVALAERKGTLLVEHIHALRAAFLVVKGDRMMGFPRIREGPPILRETDRYAWVSK